MAQLREKIHTKNIVGLAFCLTRIPTGIDTLFFSSIPNVSIDYCSIPFLIWVRIYHEAHVSNCPWIIRVMCHSKIRQTLFLSFTYKVSQKSFSRFYENQTKERKNYVISDIKWYGIIFSIYIHPLN